MNPSSQPQPPLDLQARRHQAYRQLAFAILGPDAPQSDTALAQAMAEHARLLKSATTGKVVPLRPRRRAA